MDTWRYAIEQDGDLYKVVVEYLENDETQMGYCDASASSTESPQGLVDVLNMMLADVKLAVAEKRVIQSGDPKPFFEELDWDDLFKNSVEREW